MGSVTLINQDGTTERLLQLSLIPKDYRTTDGKILIWRMSIIQGSELSSFRKEKPVESHFYFGSASGQINFEKIFGNYKSPNIFHGDKFEITVQGKNIFDLSIIKNHIIHLIQSHSSWDSINNLVEGNIFIE